MAGTADSQSRIAALHRPRLASGRLTTGYPSVPASMAAAIDCQPAARKHFVALFPCDS
jgi:hypothetical protein